VLTRDTNCLPHTSVEARRRQGKKYAQYNMATARSSINDLFVEEIVLTVLLCVRLKDMQLSLNEVSTLPAWFLCVSFLCLFVVSIPLNSYFLLRRNHDAHLNWLIYLFTYLFIYVRIVLT